jgi:hypothetical protein
MNNGVYQHIGFGRFAEKRFFFENALIKRNKRDIVSIKRSFLMNRFVAFAAILTAASFAVFAQNNDEPAEEISGIEETAVEVSKTGERAASLIRWSASASGLLSAEGFSEKEKYTDAYGGEHQGRLGPGGLYSMPWMYIGGFYGQERRIFNLGASISDEEKTFGAYLSIETSIPHQSGVNFSGLGFIWWKPVEQFRVQIGLSPSAEGDPLDLFFVNDGVVPVRMYGSAINAISGGEHNWWNPQRVHHGYGRQSVMAATFEFFPIENLYITTSTPFEPAWNGSRGGAASIYEINLLDVLAQTAAQAAYTIPEIGTVSVTWDGGTMQVDQYPLIDTTWLPGNGGGLFFDDPAFITAGFTFTMLYDDKKGEGAVLYLGFDAPLPSTRWRSMYVLTRPASPGLPEINEWRDGSENYDEITVQRPFGIDLRGYYEKGDFKIIGGVAANFGGYTAYKPEGELLGRVDMPFTAGITLNPQYDLGFLNVGLLAEFKYHAKQKNKADPYSMFNAAAYIQKTVGNGALWAAVVVEGLALDNSDELHPTAVTPWKQGITWSVPVGLRFSL